MKQQNKSESTWTKHCPCGNFKKNGGCEHSPQETDKWEKEQKCAECQHEQPDTYGHSMACSKYKNKMYPKSEDLKEINI